MSIPSGLFYLYIYLEELNSISEDPFGEYTERQQLCVSFVPVTYVLMHVEYCVHVWPCVSWPSVQSCDSAGGNNPAM